METVLSVQTVSKIYPMGSVSVHALQNVTLGLEAGEFVVLLGTSGSGKSTLLNLMGGLDTPTSGIINYRDHRLSIATERELTRFRREHVGFVFQILQSHPRLDGARERGTRNRHRRASARSR